MARNFRKPLRCAARKREPNSKALGRQMREKMELVNLAVEYEIEVSPRMTAEQMRRHIARTLQERGPQVMARETKPITREQLIRLYGKQGGEKMARKLEKALQNREIALKRRITMLRKLAEEEKKG